MGDSSASPEILAFMRLRTALLSVPSVENWEAVLNLAVQQALACVQRSQDVPWYWTAAAKDNFTAQGNICARAVDTMRGWLRQFALEPDKQRQVSDDWSSQGLAMLQSVYMTQAALGEGFQWMDRALDLLKGDIRQGLDDLAGGALDLMPPWLKWTAGAAVAGVGLLVLLRLVGR